MVSLSTFESCICYLVLLKVKGAIRRKFYSSYLVRSLFKFKTMNWKKSVSKLLCSANNASDEIDSDFYQPTTIQDLPDDMLMEIFSYLSVDYCRTASLVCRRWNNLTFGSGNIQLNVTIFNRDRVMEKRYRKLLSASKRSYRHLKIVDCQQTLVSDVLSNFSSNLDSLVLSCDVKVDNFARIVQLCPYIRLLDVKFSNFEDSKKSVKLRPLVNLQCLKVDIAFLNLPGINISQLAPNITSLTIVLSEDLAVPEDFIQHYGPRLRELILYIDICLKHNTKIQNIWQAKFPLLQRLECHLGRRDGIEDPYDPIMDMEAMLEHCSNLQVAKFYRVTYLPRLTLKLSQLCTNLRQLSLGYLNVTEQHMVHICNLQQLRYLHIEESFVEPPKTLRYQILDSLTELSLHAASFYDSLEFNDFVLHAFPALTSLKLHNSRNAYEVAEVKFFGLQLLEQLSVRQIMPISWEFIVTLSSLPLLQTLTIVCNHFLEYSLNYNPGVVSSTIRSLSIMAELNDDDLLRMVRFFPSLKLLKLRQTSGFTADGLRKARELVPECFFELPAKY